MGDKNRAMIYERMIYERFKSILSMDFASLYPTTMVSYSKGYLVAIERKIKILKY